MILTCPSCGTQYVVKDGAIPPEGRQVRCAACKHSWHQDPDETPANEADAAVDLPVPDEQPANLTGMSEAAPDDEPASETDESLTEATLIEPRSGPEAEQRAYEEALMDEPTAVPEASPTPSSTYANAPFDIGRREPEPESTRWQRPRYTENEGDEFSPFPVVDDDEPRRRSAILPILIVILVVVVLAAAFWFLAPPDLKARLGIAAAGATPLALVTTHMDRQRLESGNELLTVTGRVINPTGKDQSVPPLQAQLKTHTGKVVYSWTIAPPARTLAAGATASFNSAEVNVPPGGDELTITLGGGA